MHQVLFALRLLAAKNTTSCIFYKNLGLSHTKCGSPFFNSLSLHSRLMKASNGAKSATWKKNFADLAARFLGLRANGSLRVNVIWCSGLTASALEKIFDGLQGLLLFSYLKFVKCPACRRDVCEARPNRDRAHWFGRAKMVRKFTLAVALLLAAIVPGYAKNLAVPAKNPVATIVIPNSWDVDETDFGYSTSSPDEDVTFSVEYASGSRVDKLMESNNQWMKDQEIVPKAKPVEEQITLGGLPATVYTYQATDPDGDTVIDFVVLAAGDNRVMLLTLWASEEARSSNKADISNILSSIKAIN